MDIKELSLSYVLKKEKQALSQKVDQIIADIEWEKMRLADLREQSVSLRPPNLSGMPRAKNIGSHTEDMAVQIMACEENIQNKALLGMRIMLQIAQKRNDELIARLKIEEYISNIESRYLQEAFDLRFLQGYSWSAVAEKMKHGTGDADNVKKACYRYIKQHSK